MAYSIDSSSAQLRVLGIPLPTQREWVERLQESSYLSKGGDFYNQGELVDLLEQRMAKILDKPACLFFNKGMQAQFAALKAREAQCGNATILMHPLSHIAWDEAEAYSHLLKLNSQEIGQANSALSRADLDGVEKIPGSLIVELPLRRAGFKLPSWQELKSMSHWAQEKKVHFHLDGARLFESAAGYQREAREIASLFDTVYVSLYKGLGALGGAVLAGESDYIEACRIWRTRLGGDAFSSFPQLVTALDGLDQRLEKIPSYVDRAHAIAKVLSQIDGLRVETPQTNGFLVHFTSDNHRPDKDVLDKDALNERAAHLNQSRGVKLFSAVNEFPFTKDLHVEIQVGERHAEISNEEIRDYFLELLTESNIR